MSWSLLSLSVVLFLLFWSPLCFPVLVCSPLCFPVLVLRHWFFYHQSVVCLLMPTRRWALCTRVPVFLRPNTPVFVPQPLRILLEWSLFLSSMWSIRLSGPWPVWHCPLSQGTAFQKNHAILCPDRWLDSSTWGFQTRTPFVRAKQVLK